MKVFCVCICIALYLIPNKSEALLVYFFANISIKISIKYDLHDIYKSSLPRFLTCFPFNLLLIPHICAYTNFNFLAT